MCTLKRLQYYKLAASISLLFYLSTLVTIAIADSRMPTPEAAPESEEENDIASSPDGPPCDQACAFRASAEAMSALGLYFMQYNPSSRRLARNQSRTAENIQNCLNGTDCEQVKLLNASLHYNFANNVRANLLKSNRASEDIQSLGVTPEEFLEQNEGLNIGTSGPVPERYFRFDLKNLKEIEDAFAIDDDFASRSLRLQRIADLYRMKPEDNEFLQNYWQTLTPEQRDWLTEEHAFVQDLEAGSIDLIGYEGPVEADFIRSISLKDSRQLASGDTAQEIQDEAALAEVVESPATVEENEQAYVIDEERANRVVGEHQRLHSQLDAGLNAYREASLARIAGGAVTDPQLQLTYTQGVDFDKIIPEQIRGLERLAGKDPNEYLSGENAELHRQNLRQLGFTEEQIRNTASFEQTRQNLLEELRKQEAEGTASGARAIAEAINRSLDGTQETQRQDPARENSNVAVTLDIRAFDAFLDQVWPTNPNPTTQTQP